jgi:hypothetical protein
MSVKPNRVTEYELTLSYIQHMYDTRHHIFQFVVAVNTGLLAVVFQFIKSDITKVAMSIIGAIITLALTLMAKRSLRYLQELEYYAKSLEDCIGFGLIKETGAKMPKGLDSSIYLFFVYWTFVCTWVFLSIYFTLSFFGITYSNL